MFSTDKPITDVSEDKLGRSGFAERLAKAIINFDTADSYAIALQGSWGCGKTSVLNMAICKIEELAGEKTVIVKFNPWNFTTTGQLIDQFFATMSSKLKLSKSDERLRKVGGLIEKYSSILEYTQYIPGVGLYMTALTTCDDGNEGRMGFPPALLCVSRFTSLVVALFTLMPANCAEMCLNLRRN